MSETPTREPLRIHAGDSLSWERSLADYPASAGWVLHYALRGPQSIDLVAAASGDAHAVSETAATTAAWKPGLYTWAAYVVDAGDSERHMLERGRLLVRPDPVNDAATSDRRSHAQKMLAAIEALLEGRATKEASSYTVDGISLTRMTFDELTRARNRYRREVRTEQRARRRAAGRGSRSTVAVRFGP